MSEFRLTLTTTRKTGHQGEATVEAELTFFNGITPWAAVIALAHSAFLSVYRVSRRDDDGRIDRTALTALPLLAIGTLFAITLALSQWCLAFMEALFVLVRYHVQRHRLQIGQTRQSSPLPCPT